jgi:hypothetical protein
VPPLRPLPLLLVSLVLTGCFGGQRCTNGYYKARSEGLADGVLLGKVTACGPALLVTEHDHIYLYLPKPLSPLGSDGPGTVWFELVDGLKPGVYRAGVPPGPERVSINISSQQYWHADSGFLSLQRLGKDSLLGTFRVTIQATCVQCPAPRQSPSLLSGVFTLARKPPSDD